MVKDILIEAVESTGVTCLYAQSYPQEPLDFYVTFYCQSSDDVVIFDNRRKITAWSFEVRYFDDDARRREEYKYKLREVLEKAGFFTDGIGWDILKNEVVEKNGFSMTFTYLEKI